MIMVGEMTGSLSMMVPAMVAIGLATLIVRRTDETIYRSQLLNRAESPAHRILTGLPLLAVVTTAQAMAPARCVLNESMNPATAEQQMQRAGVAAAPLVDPQGRYLGVIGREALQKASQESETPKVASLADANFAPIHQDRHLDEGLDLLTSTLQTWAAVVDGQRRVIGTIATSDIVASYRRALQTRLRQASELGGQTGMSDVVVGEHAPIVGATVRTAQIPRGVLITSIERGHEVLAPTGDTVIRPGDRMMVLGSSADLSQLAQLASSKP
jgi:hypothetical protein